jgi:hypothetical protein
MATSTVYTEIIDYITQRSSKVAENQTTDQILLGIKEIEQAIKNYCDRPEVPAQLIFVWTNMAIDLLLYRVETEKEPEDVLDAIDVSDVSNVKVGDTSISLGDKYRNNQRAKILQAHQINLDKIVMNYQAQLNQFRRIF